MVDLNTFRCVECNAPVVPIRYVCTTCVLSSRFDWESEVLRA